MGLPSPTGSKLEALAQLAEQASMPELGTEARALDERVREGRAYVALVGQFKRGKSTLLNALLGSPILPVDVLPATAVVTVIRHGTPPMALVRYVHGGSKAIALSELSEYVTQEHNPENQKGVAVVEVMIESEILASGLCFVDTPGIGSVFLGNTEATRAFVPHLDAALVVLGADPPISGEELELVRQITESCREIRFVLNKADRLTDSERIRADQFTRRVLAERAGLDQARLFEVSAAERVLDQGPQRDWPSLLGAIKALANQASNELVGKAERRGLVRLSQRLLHHLELQRSALLEPIEETARRVAKLRSSVQRAERALDDLSYLMLAEQERLARGFDQRQRAFLDQAIPAARRELGEAIRAAKPQRGPRLRAHALELADRIAHGWLDRWRAEADPAAKALYADAMRRFADLVDDLGRELKASKDPSLGVLLGSVVPESGFTHRSHFHYASLMRLTSQTPIGWLFDILRPRERELRALDASVGDYLEHLVTTNSNRVVGDFNDRVLESRRRLQLQIRSVLRQTVETAERAHDRARDSMAQGRLAVQREVRRIQTLSDRVAALDLDSKGVRS